MITVKNAAPAIIAGAVFLIIVINIKPYAFFMAAPRLTLQTHGRSDTEIREIHKQRLVNDAVIIDIAGVVGF